MLCLSRQVDYALLALEALVESTGQVRSARQIAAQQSLPLASLMQVLKRMHRHGILHSARGSKGGYGLAVDLHALSLGDLIEVVECRDIGAGRCTCEQAPLARGIQGPVQALHYSLRRLLKQIRVSDLVIPGRRIDVPLEQVTRPRTGASLTKGHLVSTGA